MGKYQAVVYAMAGCAAFTAGFYNVLPIVATVNTLLFPASGILIGAAIYEFHLNPNPVQSEGGLEKKIAKKD